MGVFPGGTSLQNSWVVAGGETVLCLRRGRTTEAHTWDTPASLSAHPQEIRASVKGTERVAWDILSTM